MNIKMKHTTLLIALVGLFAAQADAQCRSFTKRNCLPILDGYVQSDNYNSAQLYPGDVAELELRFSGGVDSQGGYLFAPNSRRHSVQSDHRRRSRDLEQ